MAKQSVPSSPPRAGDLGDTQPNGRDQDSDNDDDNGSDSDEECD